MSRTQAVFATLLAYNVALVAIGLWARRRTTDNADFFLGGRRLGAWVAALSASASSSSAWTLLGVSGAAYAWGVSALWLFPATLSGFLINWLWVAPRMMRASRAGNSLTLTEFLAGSAEDASPRMRAAILRVSSIAVLFAFLFYIASQFQAAGNAFSASFGLPAALAIVVGVAIILAYTLLGGFWAVSVTDSLQGLLMVGAAIVLPLATLAQVGGLGELAEGLRAASSTNQLRPTGEYSGFFALAFVAGTLGIGLGYPGQPHVVNRFMALRDETALRQGRVIAISWAVVIYSGMLLLGLSCRVLFAAVPDGEQVFFHAANQALPPAIAGLMIAAVLSAIMSTADSQLLVASSAVSWDLRQSRQARPGNTAQPGLAASRVVVVVICALATAIAIFAPATIFSRVLFAWHAIGSAFGPVVVLKLSGRTLRGGAVLASITSGFALTVVFYLMPDTPGDWVERLVPLATAFAVAWFGSQSPVETRRRQAG